jgi:hypothetical protein
MAAITGVGLTSCEPVPRGIHDSYQIRKHPLANQCLLTHDSPGLGWYCTMANPGTNPPHRGRCTDLREGTCSSLPQCRPGSDESISPSILNPQSSILNPEAMPHHSFFITVQRRWTWIRSYTQLYSDGLDQYQRVMMWFRNPILFEIGVGDTSAQQEIFGIVIKALNAWKLQLRSCDSDLTRGIWNYNVLASFFGTSWGNSPAKWPVNPSSIILTP